jgi:hypothetical protein
MPLTPAERTRRYRLRKVGELPPAPGKACATPECPRRSIGNHGPLCSRCWLKFTPEGRAKAAEWARQQTHRQRERRQQAAETV